MRLDDATHDRESEARAVIRVRAAGVCAAPGRVEHARQVCFRDAAAAVGDRQQRAAGFRCGHDVHAAIRRGVPDGVDQQVGERARQLPGIGMDDERGAGLTRQPHAARPRECLCAGEGVVDQVFDGDPARGQAQGSRLYAGKLEQVVDHAGEPADLGADLPVVAVRVAGHAVRQRLGHRVQSGQGSAQIVRDPCH